MPNCSNWHVQILTKCTYIIKIGLNRCQRSSATIVSEACHFSTLIYKYNLHLLDIGLMGNLVICNYEANRG